MVIEITRILIGILYTFYNWNYTYNFIYYTFLYYTLCLYNTVLNFDNTNCLYVNKSETKILIKFN